MLIGSLYLFRRLRHFLSGPYACPVRRASSTTYAIHPTTEAPIATKIHVVSVTSVTPHLEKRLPGTRPAWGDMPCSGRLRRVRRTPRSAARAAIVNRRTSSAASCCSTAPGTSVSGRYLVRSTHRRVAFSVCHLPSRQHGPRIRKGAHLEQIAGLCACLDVLAERIRIFKDQCCRPLSSAEMQV